MGGQSVLGEEVRISGCDDRVAGKEAGVSVIGVQPPPAPGVMGQHDIGTKLADDAGDRTYCDTVLFELAVDGAEEAHLAGGAERVGGVALLDGSCGHELGSVDVRVP